MQFICRISDALDRLSRLFIQVALAVIVVLVLAEVLARNVFGNSLTWVEEVAITYLGTWFVFVGGAHALKVGMLINFDSLAKKLRGPVATANFVVCQVLVLLFLGIIVLYGTRLSLSTMSQPSPALQLPMGLAYLGVAVGCAIMFIHCLAAIVRASAPPSAR